MKLTLASLLALCALHLSSQNLADFKLKDGWYDFKHITTSKLLMENFIGNYRYELKLRDFDQLINKRA